MLNRISTAFVFALAASVGACNGCDEPLTGADGNKLPVGGGNDEGGPRELTFVGPSPVEVVRNGTVSLRFTLKQIESGAPVVGEPIAISVSGTAATAGVTSLPTDEGGAIEVPMTAGDVLGEVVVTAKATDFDGKILEDGAIVKVVEDPVAGLHVVVTSETRIEVQEAFVRVYAGAAPPACASLLATANPPTPLFTSTLTELPGEDVYPSLTTDWKSSVYVEGKNENGAVIAKGCQETGPLPGGVVTDVHVVLDQGKTRFDGDYDVLMHMALGDALPHPYDDTVELVTALLADPAGYALYVALREADRQAGTEFVTHDGVEFSYRDVSMNPDDFPTWQWGQGRLDQLLTDQLGQTYTDVTDVGAGIRDVVTDFEVGGRFVVAQNDTYALTINEQWQDVVLYWPLGCSDSSGDVDLACARRPLSLADESLAPVLSAYDAAVDYAPTADESETFSVTTDLHGFELRYGALMLAILNQVVFPSLPGDIAADNLGDVLSNVVQCSNVATSVSDDQFVQTMVEAFCEAGVDYAANEIESRLLALQVDATNPALGQEGLAAAGTFTLVDADHDLETEVVDAYAYDISWFQPSDPDATSDISAPIRGAGRRAWPACDDDTMCAQGETCQLRGSYLKVARLEQGCARAVGDGVGGDACTRDDDCGMGLCEPVGHGGALACTELCDASADCAAGFVCMEAGGLYNLDAEMDGLGDVGFRGCAAY